MNPDYSKTTFNENEKNLMKTQSEIIRHKYPDKIPILLRIKSKVLSSEKHKFLIPEDLTLNETIIGITTRISNKDKKSLLFCISTLKGKDIFINNEINRMDLQDIYNKYKDPEIHALVLNVQRSTLFKWTKSFIF